MSVGKPAFAWHKGPSKAGSNGSTMTTWNRPSRCSCALTIRRKSASRTRFPIWLSPGGGRFRKTHRVGDGCMSNTIWTLTTHVENKSKIIKITNPHQSSIILDLPSPAFQARAKELIFNVDEMLGVLDQVAIRLVRGGLRLGACTPAAHRTYHLCTGLLHPRIFTDSHLSVHGSACLMTYYDWLLTLRMLMTLVFVWFRTWSIMVSVCHIGSSDNEALVTPSCPAKVLSPGATGATASGSFPVAAAASVRCWRQPFVAAWPAGSGRKLSWWTWSKAAKGCTMAWTSSNIRSMWRSYWKTVTSSITYWVSPVDCCLVFLAGWILHMTHPLPLATGKSPSDIHCKFKPSHLPMRSYEGIGANMLKIGRVR